MRLELNQDRSRGSSRSGKGLAERGHPPPTTLTSDVLVAIIEDDPDLSEALEEILLDAGYQTVRYENGAKALQGLSQGELPSVIILDLMMPEVDGWTFRIRQRENPLLCDIPVIVVSADPSPKARAIDAAAYFAKPFDREKLCAAIERAHLSAERAKMLASSLELERVRALGMLVASIAHEINNPLTYLLGNLELARLYCQRLDAVISPFEVGKLLPEVIGHANDASTRIASIARGLLTFGRVESDSMEADVGRALEAAIQLSQPTFRTKAQLLKNWGNLPPVVGNESRLAQVFLNLLVNAAHAIETDDMANNQIRISAYVEPPHVIVEVQDTGTGIAPENMQRIFDSFFTTKPAGEGTGIGLSLCKATVERYGGSISVRSTPQVGTTFKVALIPVPHRELQPEIEA